MTSEPSPPPSTTRTSRLINKTPFYYGWIIMLAGTVGIIMTSPGQTYAVSIFVDHFINDLNISRTTVSTLYTVATLVGSAALPLIGRLVDQRGPRLMVVAVALLFSAACIYMGFVQNVITLGLGFIVIRMFGQGSLTLISENVINRWWVRRRGMIMGISGMTMALLGIGGFPNLINWLIPHYGWRMTYVLLGVLILAIMVPIGLVFFRNEPELYGLSPDGGMPAASLTGNPAISVSEVNWTRSDAMRTPAFWIVALSLASIAMLSTGLFFHMVSIFADNGLTPSIAATVYVPIALTTAVVNLGSGILVDRIPIRLLLAAALLCMSMSLYLAQALTTVELAFLYGVLLGATSGLTRTVSSTIWASFFGRQYLGSITGVTFTVLIAGSAIGPMPLGIARDVLGNYNTALILSAGMPILLGIVVLFMKKPTHSFNV